MNLLGNVLAEKAWLARIVAVRATLRCAQVLEHGLLVVLESDARPTKRQHAVTTPG